MAVPRTRLQRFQSQAVFAQQSAHNKTSHHMQTSLRVLTQTAVLLVSGSLVLAQQPTLQERVVALKASLAASQAMLKPYEWIETTVVSLKGEEKSRQMNRCYHGADGQVQKVPVTAPPAEEKKRVTVHRNIVTA